MQTRLNCNVHSSKSPCSSFDNANPDVLLATAVLRGDDIERRDSNRPGEVRRPPSSGSISLGERLTHAPGSTEIIPATSRHRQDAQPSRLVLEDVS
jgi:hypothetical protein